MNLTSYNPHNLTIGSQVTAKVYKTEGRGLTKAQGRITEFGTRYIEGTEGVVPTVMIKTTQGQILTADLRFCEPDNETVVTSLRTAQFKRSRVVHALPEGSDLTTLCGRDATGHTIDNGLASAEKDVTCRSCTRSMLTKPRPVIKIITAEVSHHAPTDHSECDHRTVTLDQHSDTCTMVVHIRNGEFRTGRSCDCEYSDSACDSVGGRWLEGDRRYLSEHTVTVVPFDPESWAEQPDLTDYVRFELDQATIRGLDWSPSSTGSDLDRRTWLSASDDHGDETLTEYSVYVHGISMGQRDKLFTSI